MTGYFSWTGTAGRSEYWAVIIITWLLGIVGVLAGIGMASIGGAAAFIGGLVIVAVVILELWAVFSTAVRRCRSAGITPWWALALLVPYVGFVIMIVLGSLRPEE